MTMKLMMCCRYIGLSCLVMLLPATQAVGQEVNVQAAHSGTYLTPGRDGEGWLVEVLSPDAALIIWFTFTPAGSPDGVQAWFGGVGGIDGNRIVVDAANITSGAVFGPDFDPDDVLRTTWGSITFEFADDRGGSMSFSGLPAYGSGSRPFQRVSGIVGLPFGVPAGQLPPPAPGQPGISGTWVDPSHDGEGWFLQEVAPGVLVMAWFTFNDIGQQVWVIGTGELQDGVAIFTSARIADGTDFGDAFDQAQVNRMRWGDIRIVFVDCDTAILTYQSDLPEFGGGQLLPLRLTSLQNLDCALPAPANVNAASWRITSNTGPELSSMPAARLGDAIYVAGGFSTGFFSSNELWRYQPASNVWTRLQDMPEARDLAALVAFDGSLYLLGGFFTNFFDGAPMNNNWRYDPETNQWVVLAPMPIGRAAGGAAVIGDFIYAAGGNANGSVSRYSPAEDVWEDIAIDDSFERNSSAVVAFQGEIWIMGGGGREPATQPINNRVAIFDPITRSSRAGPALSNARSGFAAATVGGRIVISGGQTFLPPMVLSSAEAYDPETGSWMFIANPPIPVQAVSGVEFDGDFHSLLGSSVMDALDNIGRVQILEIPPP